MKRVASIILMVVIMLLLVSCGTGPSSGSGTEVVTESDQQQASDSKPDESAFGTRQNPVPIETEVKVGPNWHITILEILPDAWSIIKETNQFNDPPEEGHQFVMANIQFSYAGEESDTPWVSLILKYLGSDGNTYSSGCGVLPKSYDDIGEQFPGASAEGHVAWEVPSDAVVGGAILIEESFSFEDTRVFFEGVR
ncbi:MAG: hypothetical protein GX878_00675 [Firmicutes bacterium]|nr:hypothetical protein [Bacillota bacterium]